MHEAQIPSGIPSQHIVWNGARYLTTRQLARALSVDSDDVRSAMAKNRSLIREDEEYVILRRDDLCKFKKSKPCGISRQTMQIALWTVRGVARMAEILVQEELIHA